MANSEPREPRKELHLLLAFRRNKDNEDKKVLCRREVIRDEPVDLERLKVKLRKITGVWRIHRTVNARNVAKAANIPATTCSLRMARLCDAPPSTSGWFTVVTKRLVG